ncbi:hypothetical protein ACHAP5_004059 [Fusarium lateritium]
MSPSEMAGIALDMARARASRESPTSDIPRSPWPESRRPFNPYSPFETPEAAMVSLIDRQRNEFSQLLRRTHRLSRQSSRQSSRVSSRPYPPRPFLSFPPRSPRTVSDRPRPFISSDIPDIGDLNIDAEGESSGSATRLSNQSDTIPPEYPPEYEMYTPWEMDALRRSALGAVPDDHMMTNLMTENFAEMSLPESEEVEADDADSTTGQDGSEPDLARLDRTRLDLLARYESIGRNLRNR